MPAAELSTRQVVVGPNMPDKKSGMGRIMSIKTPREYDIAALIARLPEDQKPDLIVVLFDAFQSSVPRNLQAVSCRKILYLADTHHGPAPLCTAFAYIAQEKFDRYAIAHDPHHLHWFVENNVAPFSVQLNISAREVIKPMFPSSRKNEIVFVGQVAKVHTWRAKLLARLEAEQLHLRHQRIPAQDAASYYDTHQLCLNSSNGDWTMRFFEVLAAGGCLLTDRLSEATGYAQHFRDGEDLIFYDDEDDLVEKARYYLAKPEVCLAIARSGHAKYKHHFSEDKRKQRFLEFAFANDERAAEIAGQDRGVDPRCAATGVDGVQFQSRILVYEQMQELQRADKIKHLQFSPLTPAIVPQDLSDLMRLKGQGEAASTCLIVQEREVSDLQQAPRYIYIMTDAKPDPALIAQLKDKGYAPPTNLIMRHAGLFEHTP